MEPIKLTRAKSAKDIIHQKRDILQFEGVWKEIMGQPEAGFWGIVWAKSFSGKTTFLIEFAKYLAENFGGVLYNSLEEGNVGTFATSIERAGMKDVNGFRMVQEPWDHFIHRLSKRKSPNFGIVDSLQYTGIDYTQYKTDKEMLRKKGKSIIFISHAQGNNPEGKTGEKVRFDVDLKIQMIGYIAKVQMRGNGSKIHLLWEQGAKDYWGEKKLKLILAGKYWPGDKK